MITSRANSFASSFLTFINLYFVSTMLQAEHQIPNILLILSDDLGYPMIL